MFFNHSARPSSFVQKINGKLLAAETGARRSTRLYISMGYLFINMAEVTRPGVRLLNSPPSYLHDSANALYLIASSSHSAAIAKLALIFS